MVHIIRFLFNLKVESAQTRCLNKAIQNSDSAIHMHLKNVFSVVCLTIKIDIWENIAIYFYVLCTMYASKMKYEELKVETCLEYM